MDGTGPDDIWAVGIITTGSNTSSVATMHFDGATWSLVPAPNMPGATTTSLGKVSAISPDDVWAVGGWSASDGYSKTLVEHWDGAVWSIVDVPHEGANINGVDGVAADDVWIVGTIGGDGLHSFLTHWDGSSWTNFPFEDPGLGGELYNVMMLSPNDGWAVGDGYENNPTLTQVPRMLQWDGISWSSVEAPYGSSSNAASSVAGSGPNDVWAVGQRSDLFTTGPYYSLAEHWDGTSWTHFVMDDPGVWNFLGGLSSVPGGDTWAVGSYQYDSSVYPASIPAWILRWDGSSWSRERVPLVGGNESEGMAAVYAAGANNVWVIGSRSIAFHGTSTSMLHCSTDPDLDGIENAADNCPNWYNPAQTLPSWPVPAGDTDCDGFPDDVAASGRAAESTIGTDPLNSCADTATPNDEADAMPPDFNDDTFITGQDLAKYGGPGGAYNHKVSDGPFNGIPGARFDFNGDGFITGQDTGKFQAYFNKTCA